MVVEPTKVLAETLSDYMDFSVQTKDLQHVVLGCNVTYVSFGKCQKLLEQMPANIILVVDEQHLWNRYQLQIFNRFLSNVSNSIVYLSATPTMKPDFVVAGKRFNISEQFLDGQFSIQRVMDVVQKEKFKVGVVFVPTIAMVTQLYHWYLQRRSHLQVQVIPLSSEHKQIFMQHNFDQHKAQKQLIVATDIAQQGLTLPDCDFVLDSGLKTV